MSGRYHNIKVAAWEYCKVLASGNPHNDTPE